MYVNCLEEFNRQRDLAIEKYEKEIICNKKTNVKKYYNYLSRKEKYAGNRISLKNNGRIENDEEKCAEILNKYFASVYTRGMSNLNVDTSKIPYIDPMNDIIITVTEIRHEVENLDTSKASGPDEIPAFLVKKFIDVFVPIFEIIFNKSYDEGRVPVMMKKANVSPIFKSGEKTDPGNFRPVSVTSVVGKIFERVIKNHIEAHISDNNIMSEAQHGFRKKTFDVNKFD